jgi:hypothetical protein
MSTGLKLRIDVSKLDSLDAPQTAISPSPLIGDAEFAIRTKGPGHLAPAPGDAALLSPLYQPQPVRSKSAPHELRKLLVHLLDQLQQRAKAPSIFDSLKGANNDGGKGRFGAVVGTVLGAVRLQATLQSSMQASTHSSAHGREASLSAGKTLLDEDADEDDGIDGDFHTDEAYELVVKLNDVLNISAKQGWQLMADR